MGRLASRLVVLVTVAALIVGGLQIAASASSIPFGTPATIAVGHLPFGVTTGDLNGDGRPDLVAPNFGDNNVSVLLGHGDGTFTPAASSPITVGTQPVSVAIGDLNGDRKPDLAVANSGATTVSVLLGNGDGTFAPATPAAVGSVPSAVAMDDFDGDGRLDLVVPNFGSNNVSVLLGHGDGTFTSAPSSPITVGAGPGSVRTGDLNGDGKPDLAVANNTSGTVSILLGAGDGTFTAQSPVTVGTSPDSVDIGDLNGDGKPDLVVANYNSNSVSVLRGLGNGAFIPAPSSPIAVGAQPRSVTLGDLNGDGKRDLVVTDNGVSIFLGNGNATFTEVPGSPIGTIPGAVGAAIGDYNSDGKPDLAIADEGSDDVAVLLDLPSATFAPAVTTAVGSSPFFVATGDINGDGKPDVAVANGGDNTVSVLLGNGNGAFTPAPSSPIGVGANPQSVAIGDLNHDGKPDLVVGNFDDSTVTVLLGQGDGTFTPAAGSPISLVGAQSVAIGDLDANGIPDLVVSGGLNNLAILLGNGDGTFASPNNITVGSLPFGVAIGDLNADGTPDLAVTNTGDSTVSILLGNGNGTFTPSSPVTVGSSPDTVAVGDLNGDGIADLAVGNFGDDTASVMLGNGDGTFTEAPSSPITLDSDPGSLAIADLNADGKPDLVVAGSADYFDSVFLGAGDGTFSAAPSIPIATGGSFPLSLAVADLNNDGKPDIVSADQGSDVVSALLNAGRPTLYASASSVPFGRRVVGLTTPLVHITVRNGGDAPLDLIDVRITGPDAADFSLVHDDCSAATFAVGSGCGLDVAFAPQTSGFHQATLQISGNAANSPQLVALSGFGTLPVATISAGPANGELHGGASPIFDFAADGPSTFQCSLDGPTFTPCTSPYQLQNLTDGSHTFSVRALDNAGEIGPADTRTWTVDTTVPDTTAPVVTITGPGKKVKTKRRSATVTLTFTATDGNLATVECALDGGPFTACTSPTTFAGVRKGRHTVSVRATDQAANVTTVSHSFKVVKKR